MAGNMFLALTNILGESMDEDHKMEIDIFEWTWSMNNPAPFRMGEDDAAKQTNINPIVVHKMFDKASTTLMSYCANGRKIDEGTITCRKLGGGGENVKPVEYLKIKLSDVKVDDITWGGRNEDTRGIPEVVTLSFLVVEVIYDVQRRDGSLVGHNEFQFNTAKLKANAVAGPPGKK
jgi:type VI secretion system secreted protein Hcp